VTLEDQFTKWIPVPQLLLPLERLRKNRENEDMKETLIKTPQE